MRLTLRSKPATLHDWLVYVAPSGVVAPFRVRAARLEPFGDGSVSFFDATGEQVAEFPRVTAVIRDDEVLA